MENFRASPASVPDSEEWDDQGYDGRIGSEAEGKGGGPRIKGGKQRGE